MPLFFDWQRLVISRISPRRYGATFSNSTYSPSFNDEEQAQVVGAGTGMLTRTEPARVGEDSGLL